MTYDPNSMTLTGCVVTLVIGFIIITIMGLSGCITKKNGITCSHNGNKWGRKGLPKQTVDRILELKQQRPDMSLRDFVEHPDCYQYDKSGNKKPLSIMTISRLLRGVK